MKMKISSNYQRFLGVLCVVVLAVCAFSPFHLFAEDSVPSLAKDGVGLEAGRQGNVWHPHDTFLGQREARTASSVLPHSFDLGLRGSLSATVLELGANVEVRQDGTLVVSPALSYGAGSGEVANQSWQYSMTLASLGREGSDPTKLSPSSAGMALDEGRATFDLGRGVRLHYSHDARGLEQAITVWDRPEGDGALVVSFATPSDFSHEVSGDTARVLWKGDYVFDWSALVVLDAHGNRVPARMVASDAGALRYQIDDQKAVYPLYIDPLAASESVRLDNASTTGTLFGYTVAFVGDVNNDGFDDVAVSQPNYSNGQPSEGRVLLFLGSATGLSNTASWSVESNISNGFMGYKLAGGASVNGDAFDDLVIGAEAADGTRGRVWLYRGQSNTATPGLGGLSAASIWTIGGSGLDFDGFFYGDFLGSDVALGDFNCDGRADIAVGAYGYEFELGRVQIFYGLASAPFVPTTADLELFGSDPTAAGTGYLFGRTLAVGTLNNDTCDDLIAGAPDLSGWTNNGGTVSTYLGNAAGLTTTPAWLSTDAAASAANRTYFGFSLAAADVNNDGLDELLVGSPLRRSAGSGGGAGSLSNEGRVQLYPNSATGLATTPSWTQIGGTGCAMFGFSLTNAGDLNQDGFEDVVVGAPFINPTNDFQCGTLPLPTHGGSVSAYLGSATGLATLPTWTASQPTASHARFGISVAGGGDINGDTFSDLIVGASRFTASATLSGAAFVYEGTEACQLGAPCDDGNFCTAIDTCDASGLCIGAGDPCTSVPTSTCATSYACDLTQQACLPQNTAATDGLACGDRCQSGTCLAGFCFGPTVDCSALNSECTVGVCDPASINVDPCVADPVDDGTGCDDSDLCTELDICTAGACGGQAKDCDDSNDCTQNVCDPATGSCQNPDVTGAVTCGTASCDGSTVTQAPLCGPGGSCAAPAVLNCLNYVCDPVSAACLSGCTSDADCANGAYCDPNGACVTTNRPPTADAGPDQEVNDDDDVTLDGSRSADPDANPLTYLWTQTSGPTVTLTAADTASPTFIAPRADIAGDTLTFDLVVNDGEFDSEVSSTTVTVTNSGNIRPVAVITPQGLTDPFRANAGETFTLLSTDSFDPDGDPITFNWSLTLGPDDIAPTLPTDLTTPSIEVTLPPELTRDTTYIFQLVVNDGLANSSPTTHAIIVPANVITPPDGDDTSDVAEGDVAEGDAAEGDASDVAEGDDTDASDTSGVSDTSDASDTADEDDLQAEAEESLVLSGGSEDDCDCQSVRQSPTSSPLSSRNAAALLLLGLAGVVIRSRRNRRA